MLKGFRSSRLLELSDPTRAAALLEPNTLRFLAPFIARTRSADQVARELGISLNTLLYQIRRLMELGFLELVEEIPRRGRGIKRYRASADAFFVPFEATHFETPEEMLLREYEPLYRQFLASFLSAAMQMVNLKTARDFGMCVSRDENGQVGVRHGAHPLKPITINPLEPHAPAIVIDWEDQLHLDFEDAKAMQLEMLELLERYRAKDGSGSYIAHVALAPTKKD
jgi:DNA-binding transcriptional ArsR family regulator